MVFIKICGITQKSDAEKAQSLGAHMCGFIFHEKSPRAVDPSWVKTVDTGKMKRVGVFVTHDVEKILAIMEEAKLDFAQLHGGQSLDCAKQIGDARVIRVLWPENYAHKAHLYNAMHEYADSCAYYLFDSGRKSGGSGKTLDWIELNGIKTPHPWFLAGGLTPNNILSALWDSHPFGVDLNSGIESHPGKKDHYKMQTIIASIQQNYHSLTTLYTGTVA